MFNLLPPNEKQNIIKEYASRRLILMSLFLCALGLIGITALIPSYLLSRARINELSGDVKRSTALIEAKVLEDQAKVVTLTNAKLGALSDVVDDVTIHDLFLNIIEKRGSGVRINALMYRRGDKDLGALTVTGVARDRESLSNFVQVLKGDPIFTKVDLPVSNFAKDKNTNFTIQLSGKF